MVLVVITVMMRMMIMTMMKIPIVVTLIGIITDVSLDVSSEHDVMAQPADDDVDYDDCYT